jgi:adenosylcobinamide kinase/adenosylcobinamide-phosphate guanylyltransferase
MRSLILGGARSGKSALAETLAAESGKHVVYIATAEPGDAEMAMRIEHHRARRMAEWITVESPRGLAATLQQHAAADHCLLVDCLTLWVSNLLFDEGEAVWQDERARLLDVLPQLPGEILLVSNEVGLGVVPMGAISRRFVDESGRLHQALGALCERVLFVAAGLPMTLKGPRR